MGNTIINIKDLAKIEKDLYLSNYYRITLKNGKYYYSFINDISLLRLENYLHMPYSKVVSDQTKTAISKENKNLEIESKNEELIIELEDNLETTDLDNTIKYIEFEKNIIDSSQKDQLDIIYLDLYNLGLQNRSNIDCN